MTFSCSLWDIVYILVIQALIRLILHWTPSSSLA